jgi:hypothetical protein
MHTGYPVAGRPIRDEEWKLYSKHATLTAAIKRMNKACAHLEYGQWDDHYIILDADGKRLDHEIEEARWKMS